MRELTGLNVNPPLINIKKNKNTADNTFFYWRDYRAADGIFYNLYKGNLGKTTKSGFTFFFREREFPFTNYKF